MKKTIGSVALLLGTLLVLELVLQVVVPFTAAFDQAISPRPKNVPHAFPDSVLGVRPNPDYPGHDSRGFRNETALTHAEILCLGDSQTYGTGVAPSSAWPRQLRALLQVPVYSMSFGGYGPTQSISLLDAGLALQPKVVIEAFYLGNDLAGCFNSVYILGHHPHLRTTDDRLSASFLQLESKNSITSQALTLRWGKPTGPTKSPAEPLPLRHRIKVYLTYRALKSRFWAALRKPPTRDEIWAGHIAFANANPQFCEIFEVAEARTLFTSPLRNLALNRTDPRIAEGCRIALAAIQEMRIRSEENGHRFVLLLIPTKEFVYRELVRSSGANLSEAYRTQIANESAFWVDCKRAFDNLGIEYIDVSQSLSESLARGEAPYQESHDGHPADAGHQVIAYQVAEWLKKNQIGLGD